MLVLLADWFRRAALRFQIGLQMLNYSSERVTIFLQPSALGSSDGADVTGALSS